MARIRSIHPGIFTDEAFMSASAFARLLFIGLGCEADDRGIFEWKALTLKARLFPADAIEVLPLLEELEALRMIMRFEVSGKTLGAIRNFCRFQRPKAPKIVHDIPPEVCDFVSAMVTEDDPLSFSRDVTASERKRRQRERERQNRGNDHDYNVTDDPNIGNCHASAVTHSVMSRQMEEGGGKREEEIRKGEYSEADASGEKPPCVSDPSIVERELFSRGREVLGKTNGAMIAKLKKAKGGNVALARAAIEVASQKENPREYIAAIVKNGERQTVKFVQQRGFDDDRLSGEEWCEILAARQKPLTPEQAEDWRRKGLS